MAISLRGVSNAAGQAAGTTTTASTVSITPTLPTGAVSGDRIYVYQVGTTTSGTTPTGWTVVGTKDTTLGSGTAASGSGLRRATWYYRDYDGVWTMPAFTLTSTANNSHWVAAVAVTRTSGTYAWNTPTITTVGGAFNAATTAYTDSSAASFTTHTNGFLLIGTGFDDNVTSTTSALTQTGATFGTVTEQADGGTSTGFTVSGKIHTASVTTGASATTTFTLTLSAASQGETLIVEQTELAPGAAISTLTDDFNTGATPDPAKWTAVVGSPALTAGNLVLPSSTILNSLATYDLTGSNCYVQAKTVSADGYLLLSAGSGNVGWYFNSSSQAEAWSAGAATGTTRTHTSGDWYRVRESGGTVFLDYSSNGSSWTNAYSAAITGITNVSVLLGAEGVSSNTFDNFNVTPGGTPTNLFFTMF